MAQVKLVIAQDKDCPDADNAMMDALEKLGVAEMAPTKVSIVFECDDTEVKDIERAIDHALFKRQYGTDVEIETKVKKFVIAASKFPARTPIEAAIDGD